MAEYKPPKWRYEYGATGKGRNLKLLSIDELMISGELLMAWIRPSSAIEWKAWYQSIVKSSSYDEIWFNCNRLIKKQLKLKSAEISEHDMNALNDELNRIFTDEGWREMKKKFRQQAKRNTKIKIELATGIVSNLDAFVKTRGLQTRDEGIDDLLSFFNEHNGNSEVNNDK